MPKLMSRKPQAVKTDFFERDFNDLLNALTAYPCLTAAYKERVTVNNAVLRPNGEIRRDSLHAGVVKIDRAFLIAFAEHHKGILICNTGDIYADKLG